MGISTVSTATSPVWLWHQFKRKKNEAALETLLAYNCTDVVYLEHLMVTAYSKNIKQTGVAQVQVNAIGLWPAAHLSTDHS